MQLRRPALAPTLGRNVTVDIAHGVRVTIDTGARLPRTTLGAPAAPAPLKLRS